MIQTKDLSYAYDRSHQFGFPDIKVENGNALLLLGPSGIGKSTLLHLLGGLMKPHTGSIVVAQKEITTLSNSELDKFRGKNISIIFQRNHFIKSLNVVENLQLALKLAGLKTNEEEAIHCLEKLGLENKARRYTNELSQGEAQRVAIARALLIQPNVMLADEPTSALDDNNAEKVGMLLLEQAKSISTSLIVVTHDSRLKSIIEQSIILS